MSSIGPATDLCLKDSSTVSSKIVQRNFDS